jgi:hypothetical protein
MLSKKRGSSFDGPVWGTGDSSDGPGVEATQQSEPGSNAIISRVNEMMTVIAKTSLHVGVVGMGKAHVPEVHCKRSDALNFISICKR